MSAGLMSAGLMSAGLMSAGLVNAGRPGDIPLTPDAPNARDWLTHELAKPEYQAAKPTLFDTVSKAVTDWFFSLRVGQLQGPPVLALIVLAVLVAAVIVVVFLVYGAPRVNRRSRRAAELFDAADRRDAATIRRDAERLAARGDWAGAMIERFRALATSLAERTIVTPSPGSTAHDVAARAGRAFPALDGRLAGVASSFDEVRYLDRVGSELAYRETAAVDAELLRARPVLAGADGSTPASDAASASASDADAVTGVREPGADG